ncbi:uncharacterized protein LOC106073507 isoform X2 [Biomphalaria glabrata]|nr:uncharacterized protein LOC106073507 isoform X2 [Biomphalaria glabrata]XP_055894801.1 uncharacterized protein LOC106073507 isoform X2 [Biomphalaria glabrata]KAI8734001.1 hypothetical protein BgiMline_028228 [Biomphalaria glabrata]
MFCKRKTQTDRKVSKKLKTERNSIDLCFPQDTCGLNVCLTNQTDLADFSCLGDENQDTDLHHFTSDQSNVQSDDVEGPLIGDHETQESEGEEADLHKYLVGCRKNPGHSQFIPVDTFTLKHLPEGLQDNDLYDYIKAIADLTVRVSVTKSSPYRPKFWPETTQPYPFYNMRERRNLRTGSGCVRFVTKFQDGVRQNGDIGYTAYKKCWCRKCKDTGSASNVWWEFNVDTATHVIFDDIEANHTTLRLFYDNDYTRLGKNVDKASVVLLNIRYDLCKLKCVTCDTELGNKMMEMFKHYQNVWRKICEKYKESRDTHKLNFIVSHPHGCSKQVSVGQWKDKYKIGDGRFKFTYTTCTCPGSSGANVLCLGYNGMSYVSNLVHSGSLKCKLNYSGTGFVN